MLLRNKKSKGTQLAPRFKYKESEIPPLGTYNQEYRVVSRRAPICYIKPLSTRRVTDSFALTSNLTTERVTNKSTFLQLNNPSGKQPIQDYLNSKEMFAELAEISKLPPNLDNLKKRGLRSYIKSKRDKKNKNSSGKKIEINHELVKAILGTGKSLNIEDNYQPKEDRVRADYLYKTAKDRLLRVNNHFSGLYLNQDRGD